MRGLLAAALMSAELIHAQQIPSWTAPFLDPLVPYGGASLVPNATYSRLYFATPSIGTYNHAAMIAYVDGMFLATWKNSPQDEDQPGQRVLYSQSWDGLNWTATDGTNIMFPNISTSSHPVALFAEPPVVINGRLYAAASPVQFCLYPDAYADRLLLRRVNTSTFATFGPVFWAAPAIPAGFENASAALGIVTVNEMDAQTQADVAALATPGFMPCAPSGETTKCEACLNGCQAWNATANISSIENERTHYTVPGSNPQVDVILYRSHARQLFTGVRSSPDSAWQAVQETNITDDVSNINAGNLPDGRAYVVSNAMLNIFRDPLFVSLAADGWHFSQTHVVASCEQSVFASPPEQPWGCLFRYAGGSKQSGVQYPQAMPVTDPRTSGFYVIFSLNKEDIWVAKLPYAF